MVSRITGALVRAILVMVMIATPSLMLPAVNSDTTQIVALIALFAAGLTFFEYASSYPGLVEFRDAPPFNRLRYLSLLTTVLLLSAIIRGQTDPTTLTNFVDALGSKLGAAIDVPYSPVRLVVLMLPSDMDVQQVTLVRTAAGISYLISLLTLVIFRADHAADRLAEPDGHLQRLDQSADVRSDHRWRCRGAPDPRFRDSTLQWVSCCHS